MIDTPLAAGIRPLLERGRPEDLRQLLERAPDVLKPLLTSGRVVPPALVEAVLADDGPWVGMLAGNDGAMGADPALRARLAASGHPLVAAQVFHMSCWQLPELRAMMAAADPTDIRWCKERGPARDLLKVAGSSAHEHRRVVLRAALVCPFSDVVGHALVEHLLTGLTRAERLRGMESLVVHGDPAALVRLLGIAEVRAALQGDAELGRAAAQGPAGLGELRAAVRAAEGPEGLIDELYESPGSVRHTLPLRGTLNWSAVLAAHQDRSFEPGVLEALVTRTDCPDDALAVLCVGRPHFVELLDGLSRPLPLAVLDKPRTTRPAAPAPIPDPGAKPATSAKSAGTAKQLLTLVVRRGLGRTVSGAELLAARPAAAVLEVMGAVSTAGEEERDAMTDFRDRLGALVAGKLGDQPAAWRVVRRRLGRFQGSVAELLDDAAARAAKGEGADSSWPEAAGRPGFSELLSPKGARAAFLTLLDAAGPEIQWSLLPHLDDRTLYELLVLGTWRPEWLERALAAPGHTEQVLLARRRDLPAGAVTALAALDDPAVNAGLVYQRELGWEERLALLLGVPFGPGRTERLPMDAEVLAELSGGITRRDKKVWLAPWIASGDPEMLESCLHGVSISSQHLQWRFALGIWERQGPDGLMEKLPDWFVDKVRTAVAALLKTSDRDDALRQLRELAKEAGSVKQLARRMRQWNTDRDLGWLLAEGFVWDWDALLAEHLANPLPDYRLRELAELDDCPWMLRDKVGRMTRSEQKAHQKLLDGQPAAKVLAKVALSDSVSGASWAELAVGQGLITRAELLGSAKPARFVLEAAPAAGAGPAAEEEPLATLVREHLDGNPEAWVLAVRMMPDFVGSVPELLETAALASLAVS
ncbi:hypothetical protein ACIHCQ_33200 [Streptomyces sp. NPDC052236]|uniref:hypothetical protein n=1 Tax=Streptomyces sp. NPDC052236 TaxID=3365686 RepID=UPI0037D1FCB8